MHARSCCLLAVVALTHPSGAHEFWIEPETHYFAAAAVVPVRLFEGERFAGKAYAYDERRIDTFRVYGPESAADVQGRSGSIVGFARVDGPGVYVLGYRSHAVLHEMSAAAFEAYLAEEGLESIIPERAHRGESDWPGRERYARCAKSLLTVGTGPHSGYDRCIGLPLELISLDNPLEGDRDEVRFRLLFDGQPVGGAKLVAVHRAHPDVHQATTTNDEGIGRLTLDRAGAWLVTSIHMRRVEGDPEAQWESFWASLTFARPEPAGARTASRTK